MRTTHTATVDFIEQGSLEFELALLPTDPIHIALEAAYDNNTAILNEINYEEAGVRGYAFESQVSKFEYDASDRKRKIRVNGMLTICGDITRTAAS